jgi:translation initiation factor 1
VSDTPFHNPFGVLAPLRGSAPAAPEATPQPPSAKAPTSPAVQGALTRAVVRLERKGRGGKEVTVVEHLALRPGDHEVWLKALKAALGCGGLVEDDALILQGDQRSRLPALLRARGVGKVTVG